MAYFSSLRRHELDNLRWDEFDARPDVGGFDQVTVYRAKKKNPDDRLDTLDLSAITVLRDCFQRHWQGRGKPSTALVFSTLRDGEHAEAGRSEIRGLSEATNLRLLYRRAMGIDAAVDEEKVFADKPTASRKRTMLVSKWKQVREELTGRGREVLEGSARKAPVCSHANHNAFAQACKVAELTEEQIRDVLDHADVR